MAKIALVGYGKMGKTIASIAQEKGHILTHTIDVQNKDEIHKITPETTDVVIEFSAPSVAYENLKTLLGNGNKVVCGTTGWLEKEEEIHALTMEKNAAFFYASNYSIGVNLFFELNKKLASIMAQHANYEILTTEIHHTEKLDAPSGTAITVAQGILESYKNKTKWVSQSIPKADEVPIWSVREGKVPGTHLVKYLSEVDEIEIKHTAKSRLGFAEGAIAAALWLRNKQGVFGMPDMLHL